MDSRIALAANTQLHFQNKEGGAVRYTIIKEIGRGGSCIVYDASYETNAGDLKYVRIKECYPFKLRIERTPDGTLCADSADEDQFEAAQNKFRSDFTLGNGLFYAILADKDSALENCRLIQSTLTDCSGLDAEIESLLEEIDVVTELTKRCIAENSQTAQNQEEYAARYNGFVERYEKAKSRVEELRSIKTERQAQADAIGAFMFEVQELDTLSEFDEKLWLTVIDTVTVHANGRMTFKFQGGTEIDA